jgi:Nucleotide-diphospho-sugar transferase
MKFNMRMTVKKTSTIGFIFMVLKLLSLCHIDIYRSNVFDSSFPTLFPFSSILSFIERRKYDDMAIVVSASRGHFRFLMNWITAFYKIVSAQYHDRFIVISLDKVMNQQLLMRNISFISIETLLLRDYNLSTDEVLFNSAAYNKLTNAKIDIVLYLLKHFKVNVLFSDIDLVITDEAALKDIVDLLKNFTFDMIFTGNYFDHQDLCTGFYAAKASDFSVTFLESVANLSKITNNMADNDQEYSNHYYRNCLNSSEREKIHFLPLDRYVNGHTLDIGRAGKDPVMIHANFRIGSLEKEKLLRSVSHWYID